MGLEKLATIAQEASVASRLAKVGEAARKYRVLLQAAQEAEVPFVAGAYQKMAARAAAEMSAAAKEAGLPSLVAKFSHDPSAAEGQVIRRLLLGGEPVGETVSYASDPALRATASRMFPQIAGQPTRRLYGISLDEGLRGVGLGQQQLLDALAQGEPGSWYYNSQLWQPAVRAMNALDRKKLVEVLWRNAGSVERGLLPGRDIESWAARLTPAGVSAATLEFSLG